MPREITDRERVVQSVKTLAPTSELFDEQNGRQKYESDLEVIVQGRDYGNGKRVGPYVRLLEYDANEQIMRQGEWGGNTFYIAVEGTLDVEVSDEAGGQTKIGELQPGTCFGEMALLAGIERNATISVPSGNKAVVLEVDRPALRILRKLPKFGQILDDTYRAHGLGRVFEDLRLGGHNISDDLLKELKRVARYVVYGKHHVLCQEGTPIDRIVLIKSGWTRRSHGIPVHPTSTEVVMAFGESISVDFLGAGKCLGLEGVKEPERWKYSASVMARTEALEIPLTTFSNEPNLRGELATLFSKICGKEEFIPNPLDSNADIQSLKSAEQEIATGVVDGANLLVMDMDLCVRCGNCSLACHKVHGQSRLLRRGIQIERPVAIGKRRLQHALLPQVCMHCKDPECLTGCPTGAIFRDPLGQVDIHSETCIGCFDCATQCPYDAITMVPRDVPAQSFSAVKTIKNLLRLKPTSVEAIANGDDVVAIKCNLCQNTGLNPAGAKRQAYSCEENCPTGALVRANPLEYFTEAGAAHGLVFKDQTHAIGRNIHKSDPLARVWHLIGGVVAVAAFGAAIIGLARFGFDQPIFSSWLTMRWLTGLAGLAGIIVVMTYPIRKQIYRRRAGALRYWLIVHSYIGVVAGLVLLLHSGTQTGGLLTTVLYVTFDIVILSGLVGVVSYLIAPRIMTRIEGEPLLVEDLEARRTELEEERKEILSKCEGWVREEIEERIYPRFLSRGFLFRQIFKRQELKALLAQAREQFKEQTARIATDDERELLIAAVEAAVTQRRVDALLLLHKSLRVWIPPHVISTALMLALMTVHIVQVVFFKIR
ncbi:MAG TPA: cyclic nucleotide-binding domain-containing protein [Pyrinomonadaceae bacterium]|nr:cyclic nucleotide-binding domain-containing protein [Pyrinomonadaceae bacterium]